LSQKLKETNSEIKKIKKAFDSDIEEI